MSQAEELLNSLTPYAANDPEERFVVGSDRFITVPTSMKRIGVQGDHNVKTIPFDCPRYCDDGYDMSEMVVYIVYVLADGTPGAYIAKNVSADGDIMHFDWTIRGEVTKCGGFVRFFVCVKHTDGEGNLENHWHSEMCEEVYVSEGPEDVEPVNNTYPDIVTQLLERMMDVEAVRDLTDAAADMAIESANTATEAAAKAEEHEANAQRIADGTVDILADLSKAHKRITNVKASMSITPPEEHDTSVAAVKVVPENALPYAEVISVGGMTRKCRNLLKFPYVGGSVKETNGITFTVNPDGGITISGTNTHSTYVEYPLITTGSQTLMYSEVTASLMGATTEDIYITIGGGGFTFGEVKAGSSSVLTNNGTTNVFNYGLVRVKAGATVSATVYPMINEGAEALPYEPYFNGLRDAIPTAIKSVGKNIFNYLDFYAENKQLTINGSVVSGMNSNFLNSLYTIPDYYIGKELTASALCRSSAQTSKPMMRVVRSDGSYIAGNTVNGGTDYHMSSVTFTVVAGDQVQVAYNTGGGVNMYVKDFIIQEGTDAAYVPYVESVIDISKAISSCPDFGKGVSNARYGTIANVIDFVRGEYRHPVKTHVYTGDEDWVQGSSNGTSWRYYTAAFSLNGWSDDRPGVCTHFPVLDELPQHTGLIGVDVGFENIYIYFALPKEQFPDAASVKAYIKSQYDAGNPVTVTYADAEPEIIDIKHLLSHDNMLGVVPGGPVTAVNERGEPVYSEISWSSC